MNTQKGYELPKERWLEAADNLEQVAPVIMNILKLVNEDGLGEQDAEEFENDMLLAYMALRYIAEFARDKCRILAFDPNITVKPRKEKP